MSDNEKTPSSILFDSFKNSYVCFFVNFELDEPSLNKKSPSRNLHLLTF